MVRRIVTVPNAAFAGVMLKTSFARLRPSMAAFKVEIVPSCLFGRRELFAMVGKQGSHEKDETQRL